MDDYYISVCPASAKMSLSQGRNADMKEISSTSNTVHDDELCHGKISVEDWPQFQHFVPCSLPLEFLSTSGFMFPGSAIEAVVMESDMDDGVICHPPSANLYAAAAWLTGVPCDPACWDLPLPC